MNEQDIYEHRYRFFSEKSVGLAVDDSKTLISLFTGIIAGLLALLISKEVGFWSALFFLLSDLSAVVGLGICLLHMSFSSTVMGLYAAMFAGEENVPNFTARVEPTIHAIKKFKAYAQLCYASQLTCLFWAVLFASFGIGSLVWHVVGWIGFLTGGLFVAALIMCVFRPLIQVYSVSRKMIERNLKKHRRAISVDIGGVAGALFGERIKPAFECWGRVDFFSNAHGPSFHKSSCI